MKGMKVIQWMILFLLLATGAYMLYTWQMNGGNSAMMLSALGGAAGSPSMDESAACGNVAGHDYVDLGLSVKWATCNVGATSPSDNGDYFAWGEIAVKPEYAEADTTAGSASLTDIGGDPQHDAARASWGGTWRLPAQAELEELCWKCTWTWLSANGRSGYRVTGPNGNSIFLPAAGRYSGPSLYRAGSGGYYWSATAAGGDIRNACGLYFGNDGRSPLRDCRGDGCSIRPVTADR